MDTFSTSVSTLKISSLPPPPSSTNHFTRTTPHVISPRPIPHFSSTSKPNSSIATQKTKPFSHNNNNNLSPSLPFSSSNTRKPSSPIFHHTPATGYAAAIIDVAQKTNTLHPVQRDVHRLLKFLKILKFQSDAGVDPSASAIRRIVELGNFERHVVVLVKMLMKKNKMEIVEQVLEEFVRIYDELCGTTQVVLVSSKREIGKDEMFGIAKSVHKLNGAVRVRVRVRNLVQQSFPSFAM
jgi:F-type H+-transporting ATPase subunit delta